MGHVQYGASVPTSASHHAYGRETAQESSAFHVDDPELASASMVLTGPGHGVASDGAGLTTGRSMGRAAQPEPAVARAVAGGELGELASGMMMAAGGSSSAMSQYAQLVTYPGWSTRTSWIPESQWRTWLRFCAADGREPLHVKEAHMVAFVGWICEERKVGRRTIGASSIPQYLSAVQQPQLTELGAPSPSCRWVH